MARIPLLMLAMLWLAAGMAGEVANGAVLFVTSHDGSSRWTREALGGFREYFRERKAPVHIEVMELGILRRPGLKTQPEDSGALRELVGRKPFDVVVTSGNAATDFVLANYGALPAGMPVVFCGYTGFRRELRSRYPALTGIEDARNFLPTLELALELFPRTRQIAVLTDGSSAGDVRFLEFQKAAAQFKDVEVLFLHGGVLGTAEMLGRLAQLPAESVVILDNWRSGRFESFRPYGQVFNEIAEAARCPVFTLSGVSGPEATGGVMMGGREYGLEAAGVAARILKGEQAGDIPVLPGKAVPVFNWEFLSRWNLAPDRFPPETEFPGRPVPFWRMWRMEAVMIGVLPLLLLAGYGFWETQRRRHLKRLNGLFAALPVHVGAADAGNNLLFFQAGQNSGETKLTKLAELPVELQREISGPIEQVFRTGESLSREYSLFGRCRQLDFLRLPRRIFGREAVMWIATDISQLHAAYDEMAELADRFRLTLDSIGDAVVVSDGEGVVELMNPAACRLTGFEAGQAKGKRVPEVLRILPEPGLSDDAAEVLEVLHTGRAVSVGHAMLRAGNGGKRHISATAAPIRDRDGLICGAVIVVRDITADCEKQELLNARSTILRTATEVADISYFRSDGTGRMYPLGNFEKHWRCCNGEPLPVEEWIVPEDLPGYLREREELLSGKKDLISHFYRAGNRYFEMRVVRMKKGGSEFYGIIQDITDRRENERRNKDNAALLGSIFDNLPGYICVKSAADGFRYLLCNRAFAGLVGRTREEIIGSRDEEIFSVGEGAENFRREDLSRLQDHRLLDTEERMKDNRGNLHVLRTLKSVVPQTDGTNLLLSISIDITRQFELEQERLTMISELKSAMEAAQEAVREKSYFVAAMNHELRTPLNAIIGFSELLLADEVPRRELHANLQAIHLAGQRLLGLINDVVELSRMENDNPTPVPEQMNLNELFSEIAATFRQAAEKRNLTLTLKMPDRLPWVVSDQMRLRQILLNLVGCIVRSSRDGKVTLAAEFEAAEAAETSGRLTLRVFAPEAAFTRADGRELFDPFRDHAARGNHAYDGTGLELALVQRLCRILGGDISVARVSAGTGVFILVFGHVPFVPAGEAVSGNARLAAPPDTGRHVLLVDDIPLNLKVLGAMLARLRVPYRCCASVREAVAEIEETIPLAVFTDLWMPEAGGDALVEYLRGNPATAEVPVAVVTADTQLSQEVRQRFDAVLLKPITLEMLRRALAELLPSGEEGR